MSDAQPTDPLTALFGELSGWADAEGGPVETLRYGDDPSQVIDLRRPPKPGPHSLVVVLHGGFWRAAYDRSTTAALAVALTDAGLATANVEYRRLGPGTYRPMLDDVLAARRYLAEVPNLVGAVAVGHSAGGHLALWLAAEGAVTGAVSLGGVSDLADAAGARLGDDAVRELLGGGPGDVPGAFAEADPAGRLPLGAPQILVHGSEDDRVPIDHARRYASRAGAECTLLELPGVGHFDVIDPRSAAWTSIRREVTELVL